MRTCSLKSSALEFRHFFVFSDMVLWANESSFKGNSVVYRSHVAIEPGATVVKEQIDLIKVQKSKSIKEIKQILDLGIEVSTGKEIVFIFAQDGAQKDLWLQVIVDLLKEIVAQPE